MALLHFEAMLSATHSFQDPQVKENHWSLQLSSLLAHNRCSVKICWMKNGTQLVRGAQTRFLCLKTTLCLQPCTILICLYVMSIQLSEMLSQKSVSFYIFTYVCSIPHANREPAVECCVLRFYLTTPSFSFQDVLLCMVLKFQGARQSLPSPLAP